MRHYKTIISISAAVAFALGSAGAFAQTTPESMPASSSTSSMGMHNGSMMHEQQTTPAHSSTSSMGMHNGSMQNDSMAHDQNSMQHDKMGMGQQGMMMGKHDMSAKVTSVDKTSGMIRVTADGKNLRVHFPPSALSSVNKGDTITLHLSFSKQK